jgi:hypothetical protein
MTCFTRRHRPVKFTRVCQHCEQEISKSAKTYFNHLYTLLCLRCFKQFLNAG